MSKIHLDLLDEKKKKIFKSLSFFKPFGYLAGGTALALQINHRQSEDFDIFVQNEIDNNLRLTIKKVFGEVKFFLNTGDQISFITQDEVKITFLWYYFSPLKPLIETQSISLASTEDIIADKAMTIGRRAVWRDYVDLFYILKNRIFDLERIIDFARKKFKKEFVESQFLEQLIYYGDLEITPINFINKSYCQDEIKDFLKKEVLRYVKKIF